MESDPIIDEIREVRHRISEECGHDPAKLVQRYMEMEKEKYADRLVDATNPQPEANSEEPT